MKRRESMHLLDDLMDNLSQLETGLGAYDYRVSMDKAREHLVKTRELLDAIRRDGLFVLEAHEIVDGAHLVLAHEPTLKPAFRRGDSLVGGWSVFNPGDASAQASAQWLEVSSGNVLVIGDSQTVPPGEAKKLQATYQVPNEHVSGYLSLQVVAESSAVLGERTLWVPWSRD